MNTGFECSRCGSRQVHAKLNKSSTLWVTLWCRHCKSTEEIDVLSFGSELLRFKEKKNREK